jgi:UDP-N-acetylglucosamine 3-dehydrogenase
MAQQHWRIGIIGCGWAGDQHARAFRQLDGRAEILVASDTDLAAAETLAQRYGIAQVVADYNALLTMDAIDAVSLCLPHQLHAAAAIAAAQAGKHILVEKPLATGLEEANTMIAAAEQAGVTLMVAENVRYNQLYLRLAEIIQRGTLGEVSLIRIAREHQMHAYLRQRPWFLSDPFAGIMVSGGIHDFELLRMLGGEIEHVYGLVGPKALAEMQSDDNSLAAVGLESGAMALIVESFSMRTPGPGVNGIVQGSLGSLWFSADHYTLYTNPEDGHEHAVEQISLASGDTFVAEIGHFLNCLDEGTLPITSALEERKPLLAVIACYESFRRGERVYLRDVDLDLYDRL